MGMSINPMFLVLLHCLVPYLVPYGTKIIDQLGSIFSESYQRIHADLTAKVIRIAKWPLRLQYLFQYGEYCTE